MSATGRGTNRAAFDFYPTPKWVVHRFLESNYLYLPSGPTNNWIEPCAGEGSIIRAVNEKRSKKIRPIDWTAVELQSGMVDTLRESGAQTVYTGSDFLALNLKHTRYDVAITNPPYNQAQAVIEKCFDIAEYVVMFLRLNFLGSDTRADFITEFIPDIYVVPNRPALNVNKEGKKGTDATEYAWFVWPPGEREVGKITILGRTSKEERAAAWQETLKILGR